MKLEKIHRENLNDFFKKMPTPLIRIIFLFILAASPLIYIYCFIFVFPFSDSEISDINSELMSIAGAVVKGIEKCEAEEEI